LQKHADAIEAAKHGIHLSSRQTIPEVKIESPAISADAAMHSVREVRFSFIIVKYCDFFTLHDFWLLQQKHADEAKSARAHSAESARTHSVAALHEAAMDAPKIVVHSARNVSY
jgi:hypothetical protein